MSDRTPAGDKGTADRIAADDGGYWVRLVTKQAIHREGVCMDNCLARGHHSETAGDEEMVSNAIWSLRKADGVSYLTVEVDVSYGRTSANIDQAEGPMKSQPAAWSIRQLRHLVAAFRDAACKMTVPDNFALTDADGMTYRPDRAPDHLRLPYEEDVRREKEAAEAASRRLARELEEYRRRVSEGGEGPFLRFARRSLDLATFGIDTQEDPVVRRDPVEWSRMRIANYGASPWVDPVDAYEHGWAQALGEVRSGIEVDRSGAAVAYHVDPLIGRALPMGESPVAPTETLQDRLLTSFAHPVVRPGPRAREPPAAPATSPYGTHVTMDDVRRARRFRSIPLSYLMVGTRVAKDMLFGSRDRSP